MKWSHLKRKDIRFTQKIDPILRGEGGGIAERQVNSPNQLIPVEGMK